MLYNRFVVAVQVPETSGERPHYLENKKMKLNIKTLKKLINEEIDKGKLAEGVYEEEEIPPEYAEDQPWVELHGALDNLKSHNVESIDIIKYVTDYLSDGQE
jgi:hypothetical protein